MQGKSSHGETELVGFLATITPTPPASFTTLAALTAAFLRATVVKQSTTLPPTSVPFRERLSQALGGEDNTEIYSHIRIAVAPRKCETSQLIYRANKTWFVKILR